MSPLSSTPSPVKSAAGVPARNTTTNAEMAACRDGDLGRAIEDAVFEELEAAGRGDRNTITVAFEYDSDENVRNNYHGDYFLRLR